MYQQERKNAHGFWGARIPLGTPSKEFSFYKYYALSLWEIHKSRKGEVEGGIGNYTSIRSI
jgi:hypothetical protein